MSRTSRIVEDFGLCDQIRRNRADLGVATKNARNQPKVFGLGATYLMNHFRFGACSENTKHHRQFGTLFWDWGLVPKTQRNRRKFGAERWTPLESSRI